MATSTPVGDKPAEPGSQPLQPILDPNHETATAASVEHSAPSVFVNSEPIREDQVQNAVNFLSHPKVRGSPVVYRRSFLEKKGLSREEIDEAFRRVPDAPPANTSVPTATPDGQLNTSAAPQTFTPAQSQQLAAPVPASKTGLLNKFGWSHAFLTIGLLAASGAGTALLIKKSIIPSLKAWIHKVVSEEDEQNISNLKPMVAEEAAAAAKAAAAAASDAAKVSQELLSSKYAERRYFEEFQRSLDLQVQELMSMSKSMKKLEENSFSYTGEEVPRAIFKKPYSNGRVDVDPRPVRSSTSLDNPAPPHSKSYMEILSMVQRGEMPDNIREINDLPPNPNQQLSNPRLAPITKPWEVAQSQQNSSQVFSVEERYNLQDDGFNYQVSGNGPAIGRQFRNSRVTEIEAGDESRVGPVANNAAATRRWVPPQPPPVVMPEAAAAIRRPKSISKETQTREDDQASVQSSDGIDELQRVTKLSELGGSPDNNRSSLEIQEEHEHNAADN